MQIHGKIGLDIDPDLETDEDGVKKLFPVPVNILNYKSLDKGGSETNRGIITNYYRIPYINVIWNFLQFSEILKTVYVHELLTVEQF